MRWHSSPGLVQDVREYLLKGENQDNDSLTYCSVTWLGHVKERKKLLSPTFSQEMQMYLVNASVKLHITFFIKISLV